MIYDVKIAACSLEVRIFWIPPPKDSLTQMSSGYDWQNCWRATLWWIRSGCGIAFLLIVLILSLWLFSVFIYSRVTVAVLALFFLYSCFWFCVSLFCCVDLIFSILRSLNHFCFTWPYLDVMILGPQLTPNLLSSALLYSQLIQIIPNPRIALLAGNHRLCWK